MYTVFKIRCITVYVSLFRGEHQFFFYVKVLLTVEYVT